MTIQSQSPSEVLLRNRQVQVIEVLHRGSTHKWLGCMLRTASTGNHAPDLADHLQAASKAFYAHTPFLVNRNVTMRNRFKYFDAMVFFFPPRSFLNRRSLSHGHSCSLCRCCAQKNCTNKTCAGWILWFAGYYVPLLGHLVTWIGRCRGMRSLTIEMNKSNF